MATEGLVTIKFDGKVVMKIVAGCDGYNFQRFTDKLQKSWPVSIDEVYKMALGIGFGDIDSLVVVTDSDIKYEGDDEINPRYRETFQQPEFNPRSEHGTANCMAVLSIPKSRATC